MMAHKPYRLTPQDREIVARQIGAQYATGDELIDIPLIARLLGVSRGTPNQWRRRRPKEAGRLGPRSGRRLGATPGSGFPEPDRTLIAKPMWRVSTIVGFAKDPVTPRWPPRSREDHVEPASQSGSAA
jgi:hypothetical protein